MTKNELKKELEQRFANYHKEMVNASNQEQRTKYSSLSCEMCDLLSLINGTSESVEMERLYKKYNF